MIDHQTEVNVTAEIAYSLLIVPLSQQVRELRERGLSLAIIKSWLDHAAGLGEREFLDNRHQQNSGH